MASDGVTGAANVDMAILMTMAGFLAISFYNVVELFVIILTTFKQRSGLYFWSFIVATGGIAPHAVGFVLKFFGVMPEELWWLPVALVALGFPAMVTGQSVVLYSRLHLVMHDARKLRWVLWLIAFDGVTMSVPLIALAFGTNAPAAAVSARILAVFTVWDKVQIAVFAAQEILISVLYIYETSRLLQPSSPASSRALRRILYHLLAVNAIVLVFDVTLLGVQYSNQYEIQTTYKGAVYSIKLKLEFSVLNQLIGVIKDKELSFGGHGAGAGSGITSSAVTTTPSRRLDNFAFNNRRSKGSADYGPFSRIEEADHPLPGPRGRPRDDLTIEEVEYIRADVEQGKADSVRRHRPDTAAEPYRVGSPEERPEFLAPESGVELVVLPGSGRIVPKYS